MEYLTPSNKACLGDECPADFIDAKDKHVIILGGGDTGPTASGRPCGRAPGASSSTNCSPPAGGAVGGAR